jgi:hypothetical protein
VYVLRLWLGSGDVDPSHCALIGGGVENAARRERTVEPIVEWGCAFYKGYRWSWAWGSTGDTPVTLAEIAVEHKRLTF